MTRRIRGTVFFGARSSYRYAFPLHSINSPSYHILGIQTYLHVAELCRPRAKSYAFRQCSNPRNDTRYTGFDCICCYSGECHDMSPSSFCSRFAACSGTICPEFVARVFEDRYGHRFRALLQFGVGPTLRRRRAGRSQQTDCVVESVSSFRPIIQLSMIGFYLGKFFRRTPPHNPPSARIVHWLGSRRSVLP
jgi:hypothetical protein